MYAYVVNLSVCSIHLCKAQTSSRIHAEAGGFCVGLWANCRSLPTGDCFVGKSRDGPWDAGRENMAPPKSHGIFPWFFPLVWPFRKSISLLQTRHDTFPTSSTFCRLRHEIAQVTVGRTLSWLIRFCGRSRSSTTAAWRRLWGLPRVLAMMALPRSKWWKWLSIHIVTTSKFNEAIDAFFFWVFWWIQDWHLWWMDLCCQKSSSNASKNCADDGDRTRFFLKILKKIWTPHALNI